jgi:hypothetical protein
MEFRIPIPKGGNSNLSRRVILISAPVIDSILEGKNSFLVFEIHLSGNSAGRT